MRPIKDAIYSMKTEDGALIGSFTAPVPLYIGDTLFYMGNLMEVVSGNSVSVYVRKIGSAIQLTEHKRLSSSLYRGDH